MPVLSPKVYIENFPLAQEFTISRGSKTLAQAVVCELSQNGSIGRGEAVPYKRYGETVESVIAQINAVSLEGLTLNTLQTRLPAGAARNAVDCALWDLASKQQNLRAWQLANVEMKPVSTLYTLSLNTPENMAKAARECGYSDLKIKLGGEGDEARLTAIRKAMPLARLLIDANEGWTLENFKYNLDICAKAGVFCVEQPLPVTLDEALRGFNSPVPLCADESLHTRQNLTELKEKYDFINIKLDKTGGLTEALALRDEAMKQGFKLMIGCMVGSSLSMAPALIIAQSCEIVDLDGPLLLKQDRQEGLRYEGSLIHAPSPLLWG
jgi:L-Ala-D/L-Glu epimerase